MAGLIVLEHPVSVFKSDLVGKILFKSINACGRFIICFFPFSPGSMMLTCYEHVCGPMCRA